MPKRIVVCPICGKTFITYHKNQRFCSLKCFNEHKKRRRIVKICPVCGKKFVVRPCHDWRKFCNMKCYAKAQEMRLTTHPDKKVERVWIKCINCGKKFKVLPSRAKRRKFCSLKCYYEWRKGKPKTTGKYVDKQKAKRLRRNNVCEICGFSRCVDICHIVPESKGGTYELVNILFLCPNHHYLFDRELLTNEEYSKIKEKVEKAKNHFHLHEV